MTIILASKISSRKDCRSTVIATTAITAAVTSSTVLDLPLGLDRVVVY